MKILFINESTVIKGGVSAVLYSEIEGLKKKGFDVELLDFSHKEFLGKNKFKTLLLYFSEERKIRIIKEKVDSFNPNIVHFHNTYPFLRKPFWSNDLFKEVKVVQHLHNYYPFCLNALFYRDEKICTECFDSDSFLSGIKNSCYDYSKLKSIFASYNRPTPTQWVKHSKKIDLLLGVSQFVVDKYVELGVDEKKIRTLYNGVSIGKKKDYYIAGKYILFIGNIVDAKGVEIVCELAERNRDIEFKIAGLGRRLIILREKYKYLTNLSFEGYVDGERKFILINNCKFLLFPTKWWEPFGIVITEALSLGKYVVTSGLGGTSELVEEGVTGFIVNDNNINSYEKVVRKLWYNFVDFNMSIPKQNEMLLKFSQETHVNNLIKYYKSII
ncbi:MAG: hypothetical protein COW71_08245 [Ignavibacteriales bacterium CG18_big_fil_WC_8_21_14_2_50_31_20]|nr:MAG: hypothetical protein COW71_08245 [Ignavibacteriales bacterium CG18_big_fil_WC_8_21_14_2_50_31_20]